MKIHKITIYVMAVLSIGSLSTAILLSYINTCNQYDFIINILLGVFGSSSVTVFVSTINYFGERQKTMESFWDDTYCLINYLLEYKCYASIEDKINYLNKYPYYIVSNLNKLYGNFSFFMKKKMKFVYDDLYKPVVDFDSEIKKSINHLNNLIDCKDEKNDKRKEIESKVKKIEDLFVTYNPLTPKTVVISSSQYFFTDKIEEILNNKYYNKLYFIRGGNQ